VATFDVEQRLHGVRVFGAGEALRRDVARVLRCVLVDRALERGDEAVDLCGGRLRLAGRRHEPTAQLADRGLELLGVLRHGLERHAVERDLAGELGGVVALRAVLAEHRKALLRAPLLEAGRDQDGHGGGACEGGGGEPVLAAHVGLLGPNVGSDIVA